MKNFSIKGQVYSVKIPDSLFQKGQYEQAATAYERVYFFSKDKAEKINALFMRAQSLKISGHYFEAYKGLLRVLSYDTNDSMLCATNYELALNLHLAGFYNDAEKYCARNASLPVTSPEYKNSVLLHALTLNELNLYKNASQKLTEFTNQLNISEFQKDSLRAFINNYYSKNKLPKIKSLKKARRLSKCLPSAGLFYVGKPGKALANLSFQLLALTYTGANVYFGNYVTAASAGVFMMRAFYFGGINQLNDIVPALNNTRTAQFNGNFKHIFIQKLNEYKAL